MSISNRSYNFRISSKRRLLLNFTIETMITADDTEIIVRFGLQFSFEVCLPRTDFDGKFSYWHQMDGRQSISVVRHRTIEIAVWNAESKNQPRTISVEVLTKTSSAFNSNWQLSLYLCLLDVPYESQLITHCDNKQKRPSTTECLLNRTDDSHNDQRLINFFCNASNSCDLFS